MSSYVSKYSAGFCESIRRTTTDGDESKRDGDENANNNVERGNDDDELPIGEDENEGWNFDLMSATAYGCDLDEKPRSRTTTIQAGVLTRSKLETR